jgi:hypothetical protein
LKALALVTYTDCENKWRSLEAAGHEVTVIQYDDRTHDRHHELVEAAATIRPDFIVHIGAVEQYHGRPVPRPEIFRNLKSVAPLIHMCNDAADPPWWPLLEQYDREDCFTVQVSIDGSRDNPIARFHNGLLALTPIDCRSFEPRPWGERCIRMGMVGGIGHTHRGDTCNDLIRRGFLTFNAGPVGRSYADMAWLMCRTKITFNYGCTGTGDRWHVKGRVVEAGFAGCCLLEHRNTPTRYWFEPGTEFLEYETAEEAAFICETSSEDKLSQVAERFRDRVVWEHHPYIFWNKVLKKAGIEVEALV